MDIKQLRYFLAFSQELNFSKAAEKLFISRQALSKAIHELERELGEHLLTEDNKKLELTPCGKYLLANSIPVVNSFNELEQSIQSWAGKNKFHIQMAIGRGSLNTLPPRLFDDFKKDHPEISLSLEEGSDQMVREKVKLQQVKLGILSSSPDRIKEFNYCLIREGQLYLQVSHDNELAARDYIEIADLKGQPFISLGHECDMHNLFIEKCLEGGFQPNIVLITQESNIANNMVMRNQGISFGHKQTLSMAANPSIRMLPLNLNEASWGTYTITKEGVTCSSSTQVLINYMRFVSNKYTEP